MHTRPLGSRPRRGAEITAELIEDSWTEDHASLIATLGVMRMAQRVALLSNVIYYYFPVIYFRYL